MKLRITLTKKKKKLKFEILSTWNSDRRQAIVFVCRLFGVQFPKHAKVRKTCGIGAAGSHANHFFAIEQQAFRLIRRKIIQRSRLDLFKKPKQGKQNY